MLKRIEFEALNEKEALSVAQKLLKAPLDKIKIKYLEENNDGSKSVYEAVAYINLAQEGKKYLEEILNSLNITYTLEVRTLNDGNEIYYSINSNENPLLIGHNGRTLEALQILLKNLISHYASDENVLVSVDCGGYKENRKRQLEIMATKLAKEVSKTKREVKLGRLSAFERRIIHTKLADWRDVYTESIGEGENRRLVIKPVKK